MCKKENFTITTGIANHDFTSNFGRFQVFRHEEPLIHVSRKTYCQSIKCKIKLYVDVIIYACPKLNIIENMPQPI